MGISLFLYKFWHNDFNHSSELRKAFIIETDDTFAIPDSFTLTEVSDKEYPLPECRSSVLSRLRRLPKPVLLFLRIALFSSPNDSQFDGRKLSITDQSSEGDLDGDVDDIGVSMGC